MEPQIQFHFESNDYEVSLRAYDLDRIVLPDGRVLDVSNWAETDPPKPLGLNVNAELSAYYTFIADITLFQLAELVNGELAIYILI